VPKMLSLLLVIIFTAVPQTSPAQTPKVPFSITISTDNPEVRAGADVFIKIKMTNHSNHAVDCTRAPSNGSDRAYEYDVRVLGGGATPKVIRPHPEIGETFSSWPCTLSPGESTTMDDTLISKLFDMSRPGTYSITVTRFISGNRKEDGLVKSNILKVMVRP
jgi:hypothetical protein